jgi:hypothetical protein
MTDKIPLHDTKHHVAEWQRRKAALLDFVAEFEDGRRITVGVACSADKLDPARGMFFARWCAGMAVDAKIVSARFESNGKVLATYDAAALAASDEGKASPRSREDHLMTAPDTPQETPPVSCSVCGKTSNEGWGVGLRKDWQTGKWYCLDHRPWIKPPGGGHQ